MEPSEPSKKSKRISLSRRKRQSDRDKENQPDFSDQGIQDGGGHHEAGSSRSTNSTNYGELSEPPQKKSRLSLSRRKQQIEKKQYNFEDQEIQDDGGHDEQRTGSSIKLDSGEPPVKRKRLSLLHKRVSLEEVWSGNESVQSIQDDTTGLDESRFVHTSPTRLELSKSKMPSKNTVRAHQWALKVFQEWLKFVKVGSSSGESSNDEGSAGGYQEDSLWSESQNAPMVCKMLCQFVSEARQGNGRPYTPKTMLQLLTNLQSVAFSRNRTACHFMNHHDVNFQPLHNVLNNTSKELLKEGVGAQKKQARIITEEEEEELWQKR